MRVNQVCCRWQTRTEIPTCTEGTPHRPSRTIMWHVFFIFIPTYNLCIGKYFWNQIRENLPSYWFLRKSCLIQKWYTKTQNQLSLVFTEHFKTASLSKYIKILCVRLPPFVLNTFGGERVKCWWEKCSNVLQRRCQWPNVSMCCRVLIKRKIYTD